MLTFEQIKELVELVADHGLEGMEIERSGFKIRIDGRGSRTVETLVAPAAPAVAAPAAPVATPAPESSDQAGSAAPAAPATGDIVTSPIVGTFYAAPNPDSPPYVRVGDRVELGQVMCIVEAMKLMNEIESDVAGVVVEILPKNGQPVEFGEPLFAIQAD